MCIRDSLCVLDSDIHSFANTKKKGGYSQQLSLGRQRKKIQPWVTNEVLNLFDQRRQLKQQKYTSTEAGLEYINVNREVGKKMKAAKEEWTEEQCKNAEKGMMSRNNKESYNALRGLTKTQLHKSAVFEESSGNILMESTLGLNRWTE